jgi:CO/xanthine dehydrogenase FAD-binding subunit
MVAFNFARARPAALLDVSSIAELASCWTDGEGVTIGACAPYSKIIDECSRLLPGLTAASRTIGSHQIRTRGTIGGNLGTASPAGDALVALVAAGASVDLRSEAARRSTLVENFLVGPGRTTLGPTELVVSVTVPCAQGPQLFAKVGPRNAMVIAVVSVALSIDCVRRTVRTAIGSAGPTVLRAVEADRFLEGALDEIGFWESPGSLPDDVSTHFGELVARSSSPIDDVRGTARYRRHALEVLARRMAGWASHDSAAWMPAR